MSKKQLTTGQMRRRKFGCDIGSLFAQVLPPSLVIASKWDLYTQTAAGTWGIGVGGVAIIVLAFMAIRGKLKIPGKVVGTVIVAALSFLLSQVLNDLCLITTTLAGGMVFDELTFTRKSKKYKKELEQKEQADATATAINSGMQGLIQQFLSDTK